MNKNFEKIFAKAKQEKRGCLIGFVTGMDPDYEITKDGKSIGQKAIDYISFQWGGAGPNSYLHVIKLKIMRN